MTKTSLDDLAAFAVVAKTRSFTRAATQLGVSNSMLSYKIKRLEERLGLSLLRRTSRSVALTDAGERLLLTLLPALDSIGATLKRLDHERNQVVGTLRISATRQAYEAVVRPVLAAFQKSHPLATVEVIIDYGFHDIVAERFDAGIRLGEKLQLDMVALEVGGPLRMAVVAAPQYLANRQPPQTPADLDAHLCINYRMMTANSIYAWEFEQGGHNIRISVTGPLTSNEPELMLQAALDGLGVAYVLEREAMSHIENGRLIRLLEDWTPAFPGFHLYYPSRKQVSPVLAAFLAAIRDRRDQATASTRNIDID